MSDYDSTPLPLNEADARIQLAQGYRIADRLGLGDTPSAGLWGHMSLRIPNTDRFLTMAFPQMWSQVTAATLMVVDIDGNIIFDPSGKSPVVHPAWGINAAIHSHRPDANCVIHTHATDHVAFVSTEMRELLPLNQEAMEFYRKVSYHAYTTEADVVGEIPKLAESLGPENSAMFLQAHGLVTLGKTVGETVNRAARFGEAISRQIKSMSMGCKLNTQSHEISEYVGGQWDAGYRCGRWEWGPLVEADNRARSAMLDSHWDDVLDFWFAAGDDIPNDELWYGAHKHNDELVRQRFAGLMVQALSKAGLAAWEKLGWNSALAAVIALDQFPRMAFRGRSTAWDLEEQAVGIAKRLIADDVAVSQMSYLQRFFAMMPLQHSENLEDQMQAVAFMDDLLSQSRGTPLESYFVRRASLARSCLDPAALRRSLRSLSASPAKQSTST